MFLTTILHLNTLCVKLNQKLSKYVMCALVSIVSFGTLSNDTIDTVYFGYCNLELSRLTVSFESVPNDTIDTNEQI